MSLNDDTDNWFEETDNHTMYHDNSIVYIYDESDSERDRSDGDDSERDGDDSESDGDGSESDGDGSESDEDNNTHITERMRTIYRNRNASRQFWYVQDLMDETDSDSDASLPVLGSIVVEESEDEESEDEESEDEESEDEESEDEESAYVEDDDSVLSRSVYSEDILPVKRQEIVDRYPFSPIGRQSYSTAAANIFPYAPQPRLYDESVSEESTVLDTPVESDDEEDTHEAELRSLRVGYTGNVSGRLREPFSRIREYIPERDPQTNDGYVSDEEESVVSDEEESVVSDEEESVVSDEEEGIDVGMDWHNRHYRSYGMIL